MAILLIPSQSLVLNAYAVLIGSTPGNAAFKDHQAYINTAGIGEAGYKSALNAYFAGTSTASLATTMLANLGLGTAFTQAQAEAFLNANASNRVGAMMDLAKALYDYSGTDAVILAAKAGYVSDIEGSYIFSNNITNVNGQAFSTADTTGQTLSLTTGVDKLVGSAFADNFLARTLNNANTMQDGDSLDGGAGNDTVYIDFTSFGNAITPAFKNIETVVVRAQTTTLDPTNGNNLATNVVQIDAQRSLATDVADKVTADVGVTRWESNNSRSDVIIEDVRIGNAQKTSDVTIAMVETDPGNVDFGVYFDQHSLRNASSGTSSIVIQIMDTGAAAAAATAATPLLNNPLDTFRIGINGALAEIKLNSAAAPAAAANADTYAQLLAAFQAALLAGGSGATAALGADFTVTDPLSNKAVTGKSIVITGGAGLTFSAITGSGWFNTTGAAVPASSNIYTTFSTGATQVSELVTSKVVLDDVGRGSTGGDLVIGGLSVGQTSTSRGVERFEITVNDNSKLQTINSTNNALREVTIVNGVTTKTVADAYTTTVTNEGDLTVNGTNAAIVTPDANLNGVNNYSRTGALGGTAAVNHSGAGAAGFTDVRLIDASAFKGKLAFTAAISSDAIPKYITAVDTAANPAADVAGAGNVNYNVAGANFIYTGGEDNDTMVVTIDGAVASSRSTVVAGQSDFTFNFSGGAGNDAITVTVINPSLAGGAQAWYTNQKLNANITVNGGAGNDTIRTPGAGDAIINADDGDDTVYTDNTGNLNVSAQATGSATAAAAAYAAAAAAELAAANAAFVSSNTTGFTLIDGTTTGAAVTSAAVATALNTLNLVTPVNFDVATVPVHSVLVAAITAATAAGGLTLAQNIALNAAYGNTATAGVVTPATTLVAQAITGFVATADATVVTAAQFAAGNALLDTYITAAKAAAATASAADTNKTVHTALLNATQLAVANATDAVNRVFDPVAAVTAGTQTTVNNLATLSAVFTAGATDATVVTALQAAINNGSITAGQAAALFAVAVASAGTMDATEVANTLAVLVPIQTTAATANTTAQATLTAALAADVTAVNTAAGIVAADPVTAAASAVANDSVGSTEAAAAVTAAAAALTAANAVAVSGLTAATAAAANLATLKAAIAVGTTDLAVVTATSNAVANGSIAAGDKTAIDAAASAVTGTVGVPVTAAEKIAVDLLITALQLTNETLLADATNDAANLAAIVATTTTASTAATAAANSGANALTIASPRAVYVFDTADQTSGYNRTTQDERNLADLKSDTNETYNFFNATLKITYKGIDSSVIVAGTGFKTTDLEINQAIKAAINNHAVLSKLLVATDGPANSLVVTSLIDGTHTLANLTGTLTLPTSVTAAELAGAITAGLVAAGSTDATLLTAMAAAKTTFDNNGDYVTQWAETGAAGGNTFLVGANSTSSSDNTVTPGVGNDVIVLGTTVGIDLLTSSNESVVYAGTFGNDTIVNFAASGLGIDQLNFSALNGRASAFGSLTADKSIVVGAPAATALTAAQVAALFTDSATAINHVYVAVDTNNIGSIWTVADAAGVAAAGVVATLVGSIDMADTTWSTLTAANFV